MINKTYSSCGSLFNRFILTILFTFISVTIYATGDRNPGYSVQYTKSDMLLQNGGCVYNVKNPPSSSLQAAVGNGSTDDTEALKDAFTYVLDLLDINGTNYSGEYMIYIPDGTYKVTDTITYHGDTRFDGVSEAMYHMRFLGESRSGTNIVLTDNASGFGNSSSPKAILQFARPDAVFNNYGASNAVRNMTIDAGNNAGAVGIDMVGANDSDIQNVEIKADSGKGAIGIHFRITCIAGYYQDIKISNFQNGIYVEAYCDSTSVRGRASHPVFEYITCTGQNDTAFTIETCSATVRSLFTSMSETAVKLLHDESQLILLDSTLNNGSSAKPAINIDGTGHFFGRNVDKSGYGSSLKQNGSTLVSGNIDEYTNYDIRSTRGSTASLNLEIKDVPELYFNTNTNYWSSPNGTNTSAVQSAFNAGDSTVYFPDKDGYDFSTVTVPSNVRMINGMNQKLDGTLEINEYSSNPLFIIDVQDLTIKNNAERTIVMFHNTWCKIQGGGAWYLCESAQLALSDLNNATIYSRWLNSEGARIMEINNCTVVQLGHKTEHQDNGSIFITGGSAVEILGSTVGISMDGHILQIEDDSLVTYIGSNSVDYWTDPAMKDFGHGELDRSDFPNRRNGRYFYMFSSADGMTVEPPIGSTISLKGTNNKYVSSEDGRKAMNCNRSSVGAWEKFIVVDAGNGKIALQGNNDNYVCSENGRKAIICDRSSIGSWESFTWVDNGDGTISLEGSNGKYVNDGSPMWCDSSNPVKFTVNEH